MKQVSIVVLGLLLAAGSLGAQQARPTPNISPEVEIQKRRFQFQLMESVLENAVRRGAAEVAQEVAVRAQGVMPIGVLFFGRGKARGFPLEQYGVVFDVEIPEIRESAVVLNQVPRPTATPPSLQGSQAVGNSRGAGTTRATGVLTDDPMARSPITGDPFLTDPNQYYRDVIKSKLIDAMLDYSKSLEIGENESLSVVARGEEDPTNSLYEDSRAMILRIKGSDLALFYNGKINRDEARKRVSESQF